MTRKGRLQEIFSKALYADNPDLYSVSYRDFSSVVEVPLLEFINMSENFEAYTFKQSFADEKRKTGTVS